MKNNKTTVIFVFTFFILLWIPLLVMMSGLDTNNEAGKSNSLEAIKNAPSISAKIVESEKYFDEHFGLRSWMVQTYNSFFIKKLMSSPKQKVIVGKDGWLFYKSDAVPDGTSINDYHGHAPFSEKELKAIISNLEKIDSNLAKQGIQFIVLIAPSKHTIYDEYLPDRIRKFKGETRMDQLIGSLRGTKSAVRVIDVRRNLIEKKHDYELYFKTDTHWNNYGAYIAYSALMKEVQTEHSSVTSFTENDFKIIFNSSKGTGDIAGMLSMVGQLDDSEVVFEFIDKPDIDEYEYVYPTKFYNIHRRSSYPNKLKTVIFRDSFFTHMEQIFTSSFAESIVIWTPKYDQKVVEKEQPDIVIWEVAERYIDYLGNQ